MYVCSDVLLSMLKSIASMKNLIFTLNFKMISFKHFHSWKVSKKKNIWVKAFLLKSINSKLIKFSRLGNLINFLMLSITSMHLILIRKIKQFRMLIWSKLKILRKRSLQTIILIFLKSTFWSLFNRKQDQHSTCLTTGLIFSLIPAAFSQDVCNWIYHSCQVSMEIIWHNMVYKASERIFSKSYCKIQSNFWPSLLNNLKNQLLAQRKRKSHKI